jgi:hypothetical protein
VKEEKREKREKETRKKDADWRRRETGKNEGEGRKGTREEGCRLEKGNKRIRMQTGGGRRAGKSEGRSENGKREEGCRLEEGGELGRVKGDGIMEKEKKDADWRRKESWEE